MLLKLSVNPIPVVFCIRFLVFLFFFSFFFKTELSMKKTNNMIRLNENERNQ